MMKGTLNPATFKEIYQGFSVPITGLDCGIKCGPNNDYGIPVCCDINQIVPTAFEEEWKYLEPRTELWRVWEGSSTREGKELLKGLETGQVPLQCLGHQHWNRGGYLEKSWYKYRTTYYRILSPVNM